MNRRKFLKTASYLAFFSPFIRCTKTTTGPVPVKNLVIEWDRSILDYPIMILDAETNVENYLGKSELRRLLKNDIGSAEFYLFMTDFIAGPEDVSPFTPLTDTKMIYFVSSDKGTGKVTKVTLYNEDLKETVREHESRSEGSIDPVTYVYPGKERGIRIYRQRCGRVYDIDEKNEKVIIGIPTCYGKTREFDVPCDPPLVDRNYDSIGKISDFTLVSTEMGSAYVITSPSVIRKENSLSSLCLPGIQNR